jgi:hypothetical protein
LDAPFLTSSGVALFFTTAGEQALKVFTDADFDATGEDCDDDP